MMNYKSSFKIPKDSANIQCFFHLCSHKKITHITISTTTNATTCSYGNVNFLSSNSRVNHTPESLSRNNYKKLARSKILVSNAINKRFSEDRKRPLWGVCLFESKKLTSVILLNVIAFVYASNITIIKDVESFVHPAYFAAVRFTLSAIPFLPFIFRARNDVQTRNSGLELGFWITLGSTAEALGLLTSDAGRASFISLFTVIVIPLLESMLGAIVPARTWFGILMSVLGISMLECSGSPPCIGDLFNFLSAIFYGIHTLRTGHISRTTRKEDYLALLGYEIGLVAVLSTLWCIVGLHFDVNQDGEGISWSWALFMDWFFGFPWIPALYTGVFSTGLCLWGEIAAMHDVSALETAMIYGLEPLWGAGFAWFLLGERWGIDGWIGAALILGGSLTVQMFGGSTETGESSKNEKSSEISRKSEHNERKKTLTASPVMVRSSADILKK